MANFIDKMEEQKNNDFNKQLERISDQAKFNKKLQIMIMLKEDEYKYINSNQDKYADVINYIRDLYSRIDASTN